MQSNIHYMYIVKRNGRKQPVQFDKITNRISKLINKDERDKLIPALITQKVISSIYSGIKTEEIDIEAAKICANMVTTHPLYGYLGGRILVSDLHKKTKNSFVDKMNSINIMNPELLDQEWLKWINNNSIELEKIIDYSRDLNYDYFGFKTLERAYLIRDSRNNQIYERPQDMLLRVASFINMGDIDMIKKTYDVMSQGYYTHASPTLFNSGTRRSQLSSCFLLNTNDSIEGITTSWDRVSKISKWAGGIGLHVSNIRAKGSTIRGTNGPSSGIVPMLQVYNNIARYINQGGKRKGSFAIYLEPHHPDILEFLELKKNTGSDEMRARDLFYALWVSDVFMNQVQKDDDWYFFCPDEAPGLNDVYGEEYETLYWKYVEEKRYKSTIKARKLMEHIMDSQLETGMPYMLYKDSINQKSNQKNIGVVKSSNLCVSSDTYIITDKGIFDIKSLENQEVNIWNGFEFSNVTIKKTGENKSLNKVVFSNGEELYCTPEHKFYIKIKYGKSKDSIKEIRCKDLKQDMKIIKYDFPLINNNRELKYSYTQGLFSADGTYECEKEIIKQCNYEKIENEKFCKRHLYLINTNKYNKYITNKDKCNGVIGIKRPKLYLYNNKKDLVKFIDSRDDCNIREIKERIEIFLPQDIEDKYYVPINYSINTKLRWFEGYCDGDGCITTNKKFDTQSLQLSSINNDFLMDIKKMLHTLGINCKVNKTRDNRKVMLPDGKGGKKEYNCRQIYRLIISPVNLTKLINTGFKPKRLILNNHKPSREASEFIKIVSNKENAKIDDTFCFTEPKRNYGVFNGILTGQCAEIVEVSNDEEHAVCNLASIAINHALDNFKSYRTWTIYTKENCKYCKWAKNFMTIKGFKFVEKTEFEEADLKVIKKNNVICEGDSCTQGPITMPQIFYGKTYIGGFEDMIKFTADKYNFERLWETAYIATVNLNKVIDKNYYPTKETKCSNMRNRPIGLGIQGMADTLSRMKIAFDSDEAVEFNKHYMETIYHAAISASSDIAKERSELLNQVDYLGEHQDNIYNNIPHYYDKDYFVKGITPIGDDVPIEKDNLENQIYHKLRLCQDEMNQITSGNCIGAYSKYNGSPMSEDIMQFDMWEEKPFRNWTELRTQIKEYGVRNSLVTALMPTASSSQILGNNECFEWFTNNIYTRRTLAGDFPVINKHMVQDLINIGEWNEDVKNIMIADDGSIKLIRDIPPLYKNIYKTIWEIKQIWVLKNARARAPFVDQTQSMNIFMSVPDYKKLNSCHNWGWKNGLKTGMYYLRTRAAKSAIKFTIDPNLVKKIKNNEEEECYSCSA